MKKLDVIFFVIGAFFLISGVLCFGIMAISGRALLIPSFVMTMMSLLFFNLPNVLQKRRVGKTTLEKKNANNCHDEDTD